MRVILNGRDEFYKLAKRFGCRFVASVNGPFADRTGIRSESVDSAAVADTIGLARKEAIKQRAWHLDCNILHTAPRPLNTKVTKLCCSRLGRAPSPLAATPNTPPSGPRTPS